MKILIKKIIILLLFSSVAIAQMSVDAQIQEIKNAPADKRVELMNALKTRLSNMNSQERSEAVQQLRTKMRSGETDEQSAHSKASQADNITQMQGMERMNQIDVSEQYINKFKSVIK